MAVILPLVPEESKPKKLLEQVRDVMRLKHYSIRTERCYSDWIKR
ncbi:MAG: integron integrase, partial [Chthoniobacterales bacterium]|nr:integron integrase [Chthoniobacterales bacterium]